MGSGGPTKPVTPSAKTNSKLMKGRIQDMKGLSGTGEVAERVKPAVAQTAPSGPRNPAQAEEQEAALRAPYIRLWA